MKNEKFLCQMFRSNKHYLNELKSIKQLCIDNLANIPKLDVLARSEQLDDKTLYSILSKFRSLIEDQASQYEGKYSMRFAKSDIDIFAASIFVNVLSRLQ